MINRSIVIEKPYYFRQLFAAAGVILMAIVSQYLPLKTEMLREWLPFFLIGLMIPLMFFIHQQLFYPNWKSIHLHRIVRIFCGVSFGMLFAIIIKAYIALWHINTIEVAIWIIGFTFCTSFMIAKTICHRNQSYFLRPQDRHIMLGISFIFTLMAWCSLFQLPNWGAYCTALTKHKFVTILYMMICFGLAKLYVFVPKPNHSKTMANHRLGHGLLYALAVTLFFVLGFRSNSLFSIEGSAFHWAYFVGPTATIRSHGWLLWDTPSQYGFLNILIAAMLPTKSAWQAVYVLQSTLLVIVAMIMFYIAAYKKNLVQTALSLLIVICALHFADPVLEGPAPFPSSSVMRFFWCYIFMFLCYRYWRSEQWSFKKFAWYGSFCWVLSVLWSAESAIYCTCAFFPALLTGCVQQMLRRNHTLALPQRFRDKTFLYLGLPLGLLFIAMIGLTIYYQLRIGHYPEWSSFFLYGFLYAGGFGSYPLNPIGSVWMLLLLLLGFMTLVVHMMQQDSQSRGLVLLLGLIGCLWGISSYFVGRAVPNNITAVLPVLTLMLIIVLQLNRHKLVQQTVVIIQAIAVPFLFIVLVTVLANPSLWKMMKSFKTFSPHIEQAVPLANAEAELLGLAQKADIHATDHIVYTGYAAMIPRVHSPFQFGEHTWLPSPLQLLEQPISADRQQLIIRRFVERVRPKLGYVIHAKGEAEDRSVVWMDLFNQYFSRTATFESQHWIISRYSNK